MRHMRLLILVLLLSAIISGCAVEHEEPSLPRTETEPANLDELKTQMEMQIETQMEPDAQNEMETTADSGEQDGASAETVPEAAKEPTDVPSVTTPRPDVSRDYLLSSMKYDRQQKGAVCYNKPVPIRIYSSEKGETMGTE